MSKIPSTGVIKASAINTVLKRGTSSKLDLNGTLERKLAKKPGNHKVIRFSDFRNKSLKALKLSKTKTGAKSNHLDFVCKSSLISRSNLGDGMHVITYFPLIPNLSYSTLGVLVSGSHYIREEQREVYIFDEDGNPANQAHLEIRVNLTGATMPLSSNNSLHENVWSTTKQRMSFILPNSVHSYNITMLVELRYKSDPTVTCSFTMHMRGTIRDLVDYIVPKDVVCVSDTTSKIVTQEMIEYRGDGSFANIHGAAHGAIMSMFEYYKGAYDDAKIKAYAKLCQIQLLSTTITRKSGSAMSARPTYKGITLNHAPISGANRWSMGMQRTRVHSSLAAGEIITVTLRVKVISPTGMAAAAHMGVRGGIDTINVKSILNIK